MHAALHAQRDDGGPSTGVPHGADGLHTTTADTLAVLGVFAVSASEVVKSFREARA
ncbi:hypothetical protein ACRB68_65300 [Actinomadura sp. RB68]|uniref:Uncharacterized protein n=1 Tax=Actinomadura macrotermitis TaxID=2585200 RepID=A0A7K0C4Q2_9ACTN|nr:hypothetical protein [Actinomadura macrotermitis]